MADTSRTIAFAADIAKRYGISSLEPLLSSCRALVGEQALNVAVFGRFKAGKSSFLNQLFGRSILPFGVIPVTSVVTEIGYGEEERAQVLYSDGRTEAVSTAAISEYIAESNNPENRRRVSLVRVDLPSLGRFRGVRFVDTPGLESVLGHNTETSRGWLPNVGLGIVAVGVDPPLSQRDVELIRDLGRYTPNIWLLLTKVDMLDSDERAQVEDYVRAQLDRYSGGSIPILQYSIRPGFEPLRQDFERTLTAEAVDRSAEQRRAVLVRKTETLLQECAAYLAVALKSAEAADSEKRLLKRKVLGEKGALDDTNLALRLVVRHATANMRAQYDKLLEKRERELTEELTAEFVGRFPAWTRSFRKAARGFEGWLEPRITEEIRQTSDEYRENFIEPLDRVGRLLSQSLQDFRNRISERTMNTLGVPLPTSEVAIAAEIPRSPDIRIGRLFDHEWEMISFMIPMAVVKGIVENHFRRTLANAVFTNVSRLAAQWEHVVGAALRQMENEAVHRLAGLIASIEHLLESEGQTAPNIRQDAESIEQLRGALSEPHSH